MRQCHKGFASTLTTGLSFTKFALNDTAHFERYHSVDITNNSPNPVIYILCRGCGWLQCPY